jgi:hypothetical protein
VEKSYRGLRLFRWYCTRNPDEVIYVQEYVHVCSALDTMVFLGNSDLNHTSRSYPTQFINFTEFQSK